MEELLHLLITMYKPVREESPDGRLSEEQFELAEPIQFEIDEPPFKHTFRGRKQSYWKNPWRIGCITIAVVFVITLVFQGPSVKKTVASSFTKIGGQFSKHQFKSVAVRTAIDDPIDFSPLRELCDKTVWQEGVVLQCYRVTGGMGNIRNIILNCVRYAIEAGS